MGALIDRLWARYRHRYVVFVGVAITAGATFGISVPVVMIAVPFIGASVAEVSASIAVTILISSLMGIVTTASIFFPVQHLVMVPVITWGILDLSSGETIAIEVALLLPDVGGVLAVGISARALFRPLVEELTPLLPADAAPSRRDWRSDRPWPALGPRSWPWGWCFRPCVLFGTSPTRQCACGAGTTTRDCR